MIERFQKMISELLGKLEKDGNHLVNQLPEFEHFRLWQEMLDLPLVSGSDGSVAIQFSAGQDYWSQAYVDGVFLSTSLLYQWKRSIIRSDVLLL